MTQNNGGERGALKRASKITLKNTASPSLISIQQATKSTRWATNAKILDVLALVCATEQAWRAARSQMLKLFNDEDRVLGLIMGQLETDTETEMTSG